MAFKISRGWAKVLIGHTVGKSGGLLKSGAVK
jgi:hypothetical protein